MRKTVLALFLALISCVAGMGYAAAMDGFDLGDMPPLPPPLLDDSASTPPALAPPGSGTQSPLLQGGATPAPALAPPPSMTSPAASGAAPAGGYSAPTGSYGAPAGDFSGTPLPPPPPLAPPPVDDDIIPATPPATTASALGGGDLAPPPLPAQISGDGAVAAGLAENETPRSGQITGGRVNVRAGPNTQYESIAVLTTGAPLTVLAKNGDWLKIIYPSEHLASIHKKFVTADIPGEIPEEGVPAVVNADNTDVHAFYWDKSTVVGKLNKGDPVVIKQERGQWYRILAPANARAYVFAKYVKMDGDAPVVADTAPLPVNASVDLSATGPDGKPTAKPKATPEEEKVREIKEQRSKQLQAQLDRMKEQEELLRKQEEERLARIAEQQRMAEEMVKMRAKADLEARMLQANQLEAALRDLDTRLGAIDGEKFRQADVMGRRFGQMINPPTVVGAASWAPPDPPAGGYVGWVENIGRVGGAPSPFRLTKGGEIRFWLVSDKHDLDKFTNLRVLLDGQIEHAGGTTASILKVERIRLLTEWEIAGGMPPAFNAPPQGRPVPGMGGQQPQRQQRPPQQQQQQPYFDPYANAADVTDYDQPGFERPPQPQQQPSYEAYAPTFQPPASDPFAVYGTQQQGGQYDPYGATSTFGDPYMQQQSAPYGGGYGQASRSDDNVGTADLVTSVEAVFGQGGGVQGGSYGGGGGYYDAAPGGYYTPAPAPSFPNAQPATGLVRPSDSSQLPDVVGGITNYSTSDGLISGEGVGLRIGEVETDLYERPIINEIFP